MRIIVVGPGRSIHVQRWFSFIEERGAHAILVTDEVPPWLDSALAVRLPLSGWPRVFRHLVGALLLKRLISSHSPHAVHLQSIGSNALLAWAVPRRMLIVSPWGSELAGARRGPKWWLIRSALRRARIILTTSLSMSRDVVERAKVPSDHVKAISWGVDVGPSLALRVDRAATRRSLGLPSDRTIVTSVRPVAATYRAREIVEAFCLASERAAAEMHLVLLRGFEPNSRRAARAKRNYEAQVLELARSQIGKRHTFFDMPLTHAQMLELLVATDVAVSIPPADQRASTVLEALGSGTRLLASSIPAYEELVLDGFDLTLLPEPVVASLAEALSRPATDRRNAGARNRALVLERESRATNLGRVLAAIKEAVDTGDR